MAEEHDDNQRNHYQGEDDGTGDEPVTGEYQFLLGYLTVFLLRLIDGSQFCSGITLLPDDGRVKAIEDACPYGQRTVLIAGPHVGTVLGEQVLLDDVERRLAHAASNLVLYVGVCLNGLGIAVGSHQEFTGSMFYTFLITLSRLIFIEHFSSLLSAALALQYQCTEITPFGILTVVERTVSKGFLAIDIQQRVGTVIPQQGIVKTAGIQIEQSHITNGDNRIIHREVSGISVNAFQKITIRLLKALGSLAVAP